MESLIALFEGVVNRIDGEIAYVTLVDQLGQEGTAELPASQLAECGINEDDYFICKIMRRGKDIVMTFELKPRTQLTNIEVEHIWEQIEEQLSEL